MSRRESRREVRHRRSPRRSRSRSRIYKSPPSREDFGTGPGPIKPLPAVEELRMLKIAIKDWQPADKSHLGKLPVAVADLKIPRAVGEGSKPIFGFLTPERKIWVEALPSNGSKSGKRSPDGTIGRKKPKINDDRPSTSRPGRGEGERPISSTDNGATQRVPKTDRARDEAGGSRDTSNDNSSTNVTVKPEPTGNDPSELVDHSTSNGSNHRPTFPGPPRPRYPGPPRGHWPPPGPQFWWRPPPFPRPPPPGMYPPGRPYYPPQGMHPRRS